MKNTLLLLFFLFTIPVFGQTYISTSWNLAKDISQQTITFPTEEQKTVQNYAHGFSITLSKHLSKNIVIGTGYRFKDQWITLRGGHYLARSSFYGTIHSIPLLFSYEISPFKNKKKLNSVKINFGLGAFINRMRYQEPIGGRDLNTIFLPGGNSLTTSFEYYEPRHSFSLAPSINISKKIHKSFHLQLGLGRHFAFKKLVKEDYSVTEFSGFTQRGYTISKGGYIPISLGILYKIHTEKGITL